MGRFALMRTIEGVVTVWLVTLVVFALLRITGNPIEFLAPPDNPRFDQADLIKAYGLDKPMWMQYLKFNQGIFTGDFGRSIAGAQQKAFDLLRERAPATMQLSGAALLFSVVLGVAIGVISATRPDSIFDRFGKVIAISGQAMPVFWVGLLVILLFTVQLRWLPVGGGMERLGVKGIILPAASLGWFFVAAHARIVRSSMMTALESEYILMARAKGLPKRLVVWKHALKNASIPVFTLFAVNITRLVSGAVITETIFAWPGIGRLLVQSIFNRDYAVVQLVVFAVAFFTIVINLLVDVAYGWLDPRIRITA